MHRGKVTWLAQRRAPWSGALALAVGTALLSSCTAGDGVGLDRNGRPPEESGAGQPPPTGQADFKQVQDTVFTPICTACHAGASAPLGLRLDSANSYALIVNVPSVQVSSLRRVLPGDAANSYLVQKIEGRAAVGSRMPLGGPALPQASIDLVKAWIAAGARPSATALAAAGKAFSVVSTIPAAGEITTGSTRDITVVMSAAVDAALVSAGTVQLIDELTGDAIALESAAVPLGNPTLINLRTRAPLANGSYELVLRGSGSLALASVDGRQLDGDGDGRAGGNFSAAFLVAAGGSR